MKVKKMKLQQHSAMIWASQSLEQVHMNIWGSYCCDSMTGDEYILTITDDCMRYGWVFPIKDKSSKTIKALFKKWKKKVECQTGKKIKKVRLDNSEEFKSLTEDDENERIEFEFITLYTHEQNGIAERMNRILLAIMRVLIFEFKIPKIFWAFAAEAACYIRNWTVMMTQVNESGKETKMKKTLYELWTGKKLYIAHMKIWECECWIHVSLKWDADKLNSWLIEDVFIGYTENLSQYLVWVPERKEVIKAMNPTFIEDQQGMPEPRISEPAELGGAQRGGAQQVEILPLDDDATEDSSDEDDENPNPIDNENIDENDGLQLDATTRSSQTVRLTKKMQQSKAQEAEQKRKKKNTAVQEVANMILEHAMIVKKADQQDEIHQILLSKSYLKIIQYSKYEVK